MTVELSKIHSESRCPKCGALFHASSSFCAFDGAELALCHAGDYGSEHPPSGKQCSTCATKYSSAKKFCGVDGTLLVPWYDCGASSETDAVKIVTAPSSTTEHMRLLADAPPKATREQDWNFPQAAESSHLQEGPKPRELHNLSQVDFEGVAESLILEHAQKPVEITRKTDEVETELLAADKLSKVDFELVTQWLTVDQSEIAANAQMKSRHTSGESARPISRDKLSKVDFELVAEWLTVDQSEAGLEAARKIESRNKQIDKTEIAEQTLDLRDEVIFANKLVEAEEVEAEEVEAEKAAAPDQIAAEAEVAPPDQIAPEEAAAPEYIRPEDLDKTVESAAIRAERLQELQEKALQISNKIVDIGEKTNFASRATSDLDYGDEGALTPQDYSFADDLNLIGKVIEGKYAIKSVLAEGGMAVLYLADHTTMERTVVVKVVHSYLRSSTSELQRFEREAKVIARLNHPNIVSLYDFGFIDGRLPFIVMEYIRGMNLAQKVIRHGPPRLAVAIRIIKQICRGLEEAHNGGIIHRDLKPDNIILQDKFDRPDWVKLVDFGIAHVLEHKGKRLTRAGLLIGTPEYASPEQFKDLPLDSRSDIYSLGVVIFELFSAHVPFDAGSLAGLMTKILLEPAPSVCSYCSDIEPGSPIDLLIQKCLEKDPEKRFQTVKELRMAAEAAYQS